MGSPFGLIETDYSSCAVWKCRKNLPVALFAMQYQSAASPDICRGPYLFSAAQICNNLQSISICENRLKSLDFHDKAAQAGSEKSISAGSSGARLCRPRPAAAHSHTKLWACFEHPRLAEAAAAGRDDTAAFLWLRLRRTSLYRRDRKVRGNSPSPLPHPSPLPEERESRRPTLHTLPITVAVGGIFRFVSEAVRPPNEFLSATRGRTFHPLLGGEGRGEGERFS